MICDESAPPFLFLPCRLYENKGEADFMESLRDLFTSFNNMMNSSAENTSMVKVSPGVKGHYGVHTAFHPLQVQLWRTLHSMSFRSTQVVMLLEH